MEVRPRLLVVVVSQCQLGACLVVVGLRRVSRLFRGGLGSLLSPGHELNESFLYAVEPRNGGVEANITIQDCWLL
eukprot:5169620-Pyramimonas_sp.AAC.1